MPFFKQSITFALRSYHKCSFNLTNMLRNFILGLFLVLGLLACQSDSSTDGSGNTGNAANGTSYQKGPGSVVGPAMLPPQNQLTAKLMTDYWVFEYYVVPGDRAASRAGQGRWYKFNPDGTFESGRWDDEVWGSGNWYFRTENGKTFLKLDSTVDAEDAEWEIQGITENAMSWGGTQTYDNAGIILKALSLMTIPTREQFNFQE